MDVLGLSLVVLCAALLALLGGRGRQGTPLRLRAVEALTRLYRAVGLSVEDGTRLLIALGGPRLLTRNGGSSLAGLAALREVSQKAAAGDRPPVAVAGEASLALLAQDTLQAGYQAAGAGEYYQPVAGRLVGLTPFSTAAGTIPILDEEQVSAAALIGHFGPEAALLSEAAERSNVLLVGSTGDPAGQAALYASAPQVLIGEELFAAPAYLGEGGRRSASLLVHDILRWLLICGLLAGGGLRLFGLL
jgi:hypothetical protein